MSHPAFDALIAVYDVLAHRRYGLADVSQAQHALQAAALAEAAKEPPPLIAAALLHDVGHMVHELGEDPASDGIDDQHEALGAAWLTRLFGPAVTEPIRLHVAAKRYLCAVEPGYREQLSEDSERSLVLQGGPMTPAEVTRFASLAHAEDAIRLRRYDDLAKDPSAVAPPLEHFIPLLRSLTLG
ncbi:MAG: HD domain-containing protein [Alphaproteobacteria bacterium]|nr:MAG: HD domain-containing protein [Alphaproteobacteria bacterium]